MLNGIKFIHNQWNKRKVFRRYVHLSSPLFPWPWFFLICLTSLSVINMVFISLSSSLPNSVYNLSDSEKLILAALRSPFQAVLAISTITDASGYFPAMSCRFKPPPRCHLGEPCVQCSCLLSRAGFEPPTTALKGIETPLTQFVFTYLYIAYNNVMSSKVK
jgi:hypothetical protein